MGDFSFGKNKRLLNASDYKPVFDRADTKVSHKHLLILARRNDLSSSRLGLVIAKKNIRLAVQRNRIKRVFRESFRHSAISASLDVVILARRGLDTLNNADLHTLIDTQWQRLNTRLNQTAKRKN